jgi:glucose-1-phosphate cytidylyltransferase
VGDVDITALLRFHREHGKLATLTAARPPGRFGAINFGEGDSVTNFQEKLEGDGSWINGGYFVLQPDVFQLIDGDQSSWEGEALVNLAKDDLLCAYKHYGFWQPMDTLREKNVLNDLWNSGSAPWKCWD